MKRSPIVLLILDGWGHRAETDHNAVAAGAPFFKGLFEEHPHTLLTACGREVGLPQGVMGNSEVGHTNLGAGRIVYQDVTRIDKAIEDGDFARNPAFLGLIRDVRQSGKRLHLVGLLSTGMVHASDHHLRTLLELCAAEGLKGDQVAIHAITDGRDTPPRSGAGFIATLEAACASSGVGVIASLVGRYFAMDRDKRWERVKKAWDVFVHGRGAAANTAVEAMGASYAADVGDEFLEPVIVRGQESSRIQDGDAVLLFNYRADRMRQLTDVFVQDGFDGFDRGERPGVKLASMTHYREDFSFPVAFPRTDLVGIFPELISGTGLRQERIAETEKYAHVTYFFSGGREDPYEGETRTLVPSQKVATYDLAPEMSADGITNAVVKSLERGETDVYVVNFANADMVGHTGIFEAALAAVKKVDECVQKITAAVARQGGTLAITADHGNSEQLWDPVSNQPHTAHTLNPVPFVLISEDTKGVTLRERGILADVAPTLLEVLKHDKDPSMDGLSLIKG